MVTTSNRTENLLHVPFVELCCLVLDFYLTNRKCISQVVEDRAFPVHMQTGVPSMLQIFKKSQGPSGVDIDVTISKMEDEILVRII